MISVADLNSKHVRSRQLLNINRSTLLIVDVQEKLLPAICNASELGESIKFLLDVAEILKVPVVVSEQYPRGLGHSVAEVANHAAVSEVVEKIQFSAADALHGSQAFGDSVTSGNSQSVDQRSPPQVVIVGIESHICVLQTALDLISHGVKVFVVEDAVGSRRPTDCANGLSRIQAAGGTVCVSESVAFEWCERAGTDEFKAISRLVRGRLT